MCEIILNELNSFNTYKYEENTNCIVSLKGITNADLDEFLAIANILYINKIKYKYTSNNDIRILGKI